MDLQGKIAPLPHVAVSIFAMQETEEVLACSRSRGEQEVAAATRDFRGQNATRFVQPVSTGERVSIRHAVAAIPSLAVFANSFLVLVIMLRKERRTVMATDNVMQLRGISVSACRVITVQTVLNGFVQLISAKTAEFVLFQYSPINHSHASVSMDGLAPSVMTVGVVCHHLARITEFAPPQELQYLANVLLTGKEPRIAHYEALEVRWRLGCGLWWQWWQW